MTSPRVRFAGLRAAGFGAAALALVVAACEAPGPVQTAPTAMGTRMEPARAERTTVTEARPSGVRISRAAIDNAVRTHYPEVLRASPADTARLMFVLAQEGGVVRHARVQGRRVWAGSEETLVDVVTFSPGQMGPGLVEVIWARQLGPEDRITLTTWDTIREPGPSRMRTPAPAQAREP